ncbi:MAG: hypothetical protein ABI950_03900 [Solirubrobacteraceae bacterium]
MPQRRIVQADELGIARQRDAPRRRQGAGVVDRALPAMIGTGVIDGLRRGLFSPADGAITLADGA